MPRPTFGLHGHLLRYAQYSVAELKEELKERGLPVGGTRDVLVDRLGASDDRIAAGDREPPPKPARAPRRPRMKPFPFLKLPAELQMNVLEADLAQYPSTRDVVSVRVPPCFSAPRSVLDADESGSTDTGIGDSASYEYIFDPREANEVKFGCRRMLLKYQLKLLRVSPQLTNLALPCINMAAVMQFRLVADGVPVWTNNRKTRSEVLLLRRVGEDSSCEGASASSLTGVGANPSRLDGPGPDSVGPHDTKAEAIRAPLLISEHRRVKLFLQGPREGYEVQFTGDLSVWSASLARQVDNFAHYVLHRAHKLQYLEVTGLAYLEDHETSLVFMQTHFDPILKPLERLRGLKQITFPDDQLFTDDYLEYLTELVTSPAEKTPSTTQETPKEAASELGEESTLEGERSTLLEEGSTLVEEGSSLFGGPSLSDGVKKA